MSANRETQQKRSAEWTDYTAQHLHNEAESVQASLGSGSVNQSPSKRKRDVPEGSNRPLNLSKSRLEPWMNPFDGGNHLELGSDSSFSDRTAIATHSTRMHANLQEFVQNEDSNRPRDLSNSRLEQWMNPFDGGNHFELGSDSPFLDRTAMATHLTCMQANLEEFDRLFGENGQTTSDTFNQLSLSNSDPTTFPQTRGDRPIGNAEPEVQKDDIQQYDTETERIIRPESYFDQLQDLERAVYSSCGWKTVSAMDDAESLESAATHVLYFPPHGSKSPWENWLELRSSLLRLTIQMTEISSCLLKLREKGFSQSYISLVILDRTRNDQVAKLVRLSHLAIEGFAGPLNIAEQSLKIAEDLNFEVIDETILPVPVVMLGGMCQDLLQNLGFTPMEKEPQSISAEEHEWLLHTVVDLFALALMSYVGAHVSDFTQVYHGKSRRQCVLPAYGIPLTAAAQSRPRVYMYRRSLQCLENLLHRPVWVFSSEPCRDSGTGLYLSTDIETLAGIWGPLWKCFRSPTPSEIYEARVGNGSIIPWVANSDEASFLEASETFCHWVSMLTPSKSIEDVQKSLTKTYFGMSNTLLIGATSEHPQLVVNKKCRRSNEGIKEHMSRLHGLNDLLTARSTRYKDSQSIQVQGGGMGLAVGTTLTYKRQEGQTRKEALVERWRNSKTCNPVTLELYGGLEISSCTKNARRVRLLDLLRTETMKLFLHGIAFKWEESLESRYYRALKSPRRFRELWSDESVRENLKEAISLCLDILGETGVIEQTGELQALWVIRAPEPESEHESSSDSEEIQPETRTSSADAHIQEKGNWDATEEHMFSLFHSEHTWTRFLKDTRDVMTMALVEDSCLESNRDYGRRCASWKIRKDDVKVKGSIGYSIIQTQIKVNESILESDSIVKVENLGGKPCWDLTNLKRKDRFPMGAQGVLEVYEVAKPNNKKSKGKESAKSSSREGYKQSIVAEWYGVKSETLQEIKDVDIGQTFFGSNPKAHHTEAISVGLSTRPISVLILSKSSKLR